MAFDLSTATPTNEGFDLSSAGEAPAVPRRTPISMLPPPAAPSGWERFVRAMPYPEVMEPALNMVTGTIAKPVSDIAGLAAVGREMISPTGAPPSAPQAFREQVRNALTYQPRTEAGRAIAEYNPLALAGKGLGYVAGKVGGAIRGGESAVSPRGVAGNIAEEALMQAPGVLGAPAAKAASPFLRNALARATKAEELKAAQNALTDQAIKDARDMGLKITPTQAGQGVIPTMIEGLSGSPKMLDLASIRNAEKINQGVRGDLDSGLKNLGIKGLTPQDQLSTSTLDKIRKEISPFYDVIDKIPRIGARRDFLDKIKNLKLESGAIDPSASIEVNKLIDKLSKQGKWTGKQLRLDVSNLRKEAKSNYSMAEREGGNVAKSDLADAQAKAADYLEELAEKQLQSSNPKAVADFRKARKLYAKTYTVENALNEVTGNINSIYLRRAMDRGVPLEGYMLKAAKFAKAFERAAQNVDKKQFSEFTYGDLLMGGLGGMATEVATGGWPGIAATVVRPAIRHAMLSGPYQKFMSTPRYQPNALLRMSDLAVRNKLLRQSGIPISQNRPAPEEPNQ